MKSKSIGKNAILNIIKTVSSLAFPVITYPYVARILSVDDLGKFNFASSIISYFSLLACLGVATYAIREGAKYRNDKAKLERFSSEIFSINLYAMIVAYVLLGLSICYVEKLSQYTIVIGILSMNILLLTLNVNWIYSIFEDFSYITAVTCVIEVLAVIMLFAIHLTADDLYKYTFLTVLSTSGAGIFMFFHSRKYVRLHLVLRPPRRHLVPILTVFSSMVATSIYISSDTTILGWLVNDYSVGLYGTAARIYQIVKQVLNAIITVAIPRIAFYIGARKREELEALGESLVNNMIAIILPAMVGLFCMSRPIVEIFAGKAYSASYLPLQLLSIALIFAVFANFFVNGILIPFQRERMAMIATIISAAVNIVLNFILIPFFKENAAAFTTIVAEASICMISYFQAKKHLKILWNRKNVLSTVTGCCAIGICCFLLEHLIVNQVVYLMVGIVVSIGVYMIIQVVLQNPVVLELLFKIKNVINRSEG